MPTKTKQITTKNQDKEIFDPKKIGENTILQLFNEAIRAPIPQKAIKTLEWNGAKYIKASYALGVLQERLKGMFDIYWSDKTENYAQNWGSAHIKCKIDIIYFVKGEKKILKSAESYGGANLKFKGGKPSQQKDLIKSAQGDALKKTMSYLGFFKEIYTNEVIDIDDIEDSQEVNVTQMQKEEGSVKEAEINPKVKEPEGMRQYKEQAHVKDTPVNKKQSKEDIKDMQNESLDNAKRNNPKFHKEYCNREECVDTRNNITEYVDNLFKGYKLREQQISADEYGLEINKMQRAVDIKKQKGVVELRDDCVKYLKDVYVKKEMNKIPFI